MKAKILRLSPLRMALVAMGLVLMTTGPAIANSTANLRIECTASTVCTDGSTSLVSSDLSGTFGLTNTGQSFSGTAYIIALEPNVTTFTGTLTISGGQTETFSGSGFSSGFLSDFNSSLGLPSNTYQFSSLASASAQVGVTATSFFVREWSATTGYTGSSLANCCSFNLPLGTVVVAFAKDSNGNFIHTPLSGSLTVPEPSSILLMGFALLGIGVWHRMRPKELRA